MNKQDLYNDYTQTMQKIADVVNTIAILGWDKEVNLPPKGARFRSQQVATLSGIVHELFVDDKFGKLLTRLNTGNSLSIRHKKNISLTLKDYQREQKLTKNFVIKRSEVTSAAYHAWLAARKANDFNLYKGALKDLVDVKREEAELIGYKEHPYDALMEEFEPDASTKNLEALFADVRKQLVDFTRQIRKQPQVEDSFLHKFFPKDKQWDFGLEILKNLGYDFDAGRQDISPHPFTTNFSPEDVRVTTRIDENDFSNMVWSCIHECGHALYEQGLPSSEYGLPLGAHISLGIHESQSRLYENNLGRSRSFWKPHFPKLKKLFKENLSGVDLDKFYRSINRVSPSFIRTESDELHYHFHVLIRFEIEKGLIEGSLEVEGLDKVWNKKYKEYLDIEVPDDRNGILQDIHWSHGSFGYFPTYSLGSFYGAQFFHQANKEISNLKQLTEEGNNLPLLTWLRENIHKHGRYYTAEELCKKVTGEPLNFGYFMDYAQNKFTEIYNI